MSFEVTKEWIDSVRDISPDVEIGVEYIPENTDELKHFIALKVWQRLNDGNGRAVDDDGNCQYLADDGNKCAVGIFMKDDNPANNCGGNIHGLLNEYEKVVPNFFDDRQKFLRRFQEIHDDEGSWKDETFIRVDKFIDCCDINNVDSSKIVALKS